ncbi:MAG TPA: YncE family protein [Rhizomicrobium sp.]|nr:YncE family protein [Rhizomicrobium sp.]
MAPHPNKDRALRLLIAAAAFAAVATLPAAAAPPDYRVTATIPLGGGERWDYVTYDPSSGLAYVAHGGEVTVADVAGRKVVGHIGPLPGGTHGIAVSHDTGTGFTDDGKAGVAAVFDLKSLTIETTVKTAEDADGILYDTASRHIYVVNGDSGTITAIDPKTNAVLATIAGGGGLEAGLSDGAGKLFVLGAEKAELLAVDTATNAVTAHTPLTGCEKPHGIAMDRASRRIFATCANRVMVVANADTGAILATLPIGGYSDGAAFDPVRKYAFSSNGDGTLTVVQEKDPATFVLLGNVTTAVTARTMDIDPKTGRLFLVAADVAKIDPPAQPGGRPHVTFVPGSTKLLILDPPMH